ncbi:MAG: DPP IV N-terminal domain-containing protein [Planctomycetes bacterium]|nr:DPP IV N-terminal domain-containing protein [Planctomycetota bacterium]
MGTTNSAVRVGVVRTKSGKTEWLDDLPGDPRQHYIPRFYWGGNSKSLVLQRMNRLQNTNTLWMANLKKNTLKPFFVHFDQYLWGTYGPTYQRCVGP